MHTIEAVRRPAVSIAADRTIRDAAVLMEESGVGALAVMDGIQLVGLVTDRDLVRRGIAQDVPSDARVDSMMSTPVVQIRAEADLHHAFALFRRHAIRRLPVVRDDQLVGMISVDDLLIDLAGDLADLARPVTGEAVFGQHDAPLPVQG